jgi:hypothetical protein
MSTTNTTRRGILAAVPAIAVAMAPVAATALSGLPASVAADAELLALGRQLAPLVIEDHEARAIDAAHHVEFERRCEALIGPKNDSEEYFAARGRIVEEMRDKWPDFAEGLDLDDDGYNGHRGWSAIHGDLHPLCDRILEQTATTREGLAVQVTAFLAGYSEIVDDSMEDYPPVMAFLASLCGFAGVPFPY